MLFQFIIPAACAFTYVVSALMLKRASTLGVGCLLVASVGYHAYIGSDPQPRELLITAFLFITAPISAHLMAKAALSLRMDDMPQLPGGSEDTHVPERPDHAPDERA